MALLPILRYPDPRLHTRAAPVREVDDTVRKLIADMAETMYEAPGIGLAATQVDVHRRIVVIDVSEDKSALLALINPEIIRASRETMEMWDDCFSFPELMVRVRRHAEVTVQYLDERNQTQTLIAQGDLSELLQHEIDHLDGILATDRAIDHRSLALRRVVRA